MIDFWIDFLLKLAPFWDPSWDPRAAQDGPRTPPRRSQDATKTAQEPQEHPKSKFNRCLSIFAPNLDLLNPIFDLPKTLRDLLLSYFVKRLEARWRVRSFAALWISAAPGLVPAHGV